MSRRNNNSSDGCLMYIIPLCIIFAPILWVLKILSENLVAILIALFVIGLIIALIVIIKKVADKNAAIEAERQRNLAIVNSSEPYPKLVSVPSTRTFSNKEEETINLKFREFLEQQNKVIRAQTHYDYLSEKSRALTALGRAEEATQLSEALAVARTTLSEAQSKRITYESKNISKFYRDSTIKSDFSLFADKLATERIALIGEFFQAPYAKSVKVDSSNALIFLPCCVLQYSSLNNFIKVFGYNSVSVSKYISHELLNGRRAPDDEIEHIGYRYETKDGRRDMRYSYENNPSYTFVYRGEVTIKCGTFSYEQKFRNNSLTESFEKAFSNYLTLVKGKYASVIKQVLNADSDFVQASSVETFMNQQAAAERLRVAEEKAKKAKEEQERLEREEIEKARLRAEQLEREAKAREEKKKADLLRNFTIVDNTLTSWYGSERHLEIPEGLITVIGTAFRWKSSLESIVIPEGVSKIQANAFHGSTSLKKIVIPSTAKDIGKEAFIGCTALTEIDLPKGLKIIPSKLFANCSSLKSVSIPYGVKKIEEGAFSGCTSLQEIILPEGIISIGNDAFENCVSLKRIKIPNSVVSFGDNALSGCAFLENVILGNGITKIPEACFVGQKRLKEVVVGSGMTEIGDRAFRNCTALQSFST